MEEEQFRGKYRDGVSYKDYGFISVPSKQDTFKKVVYEALRQKFGKDVERKNKSIKINGNTYRKDADAVPALRYRNYLNDSLRNVDNYFPGILIRADDGEEIINYPELHIRNGIEKNKNTNHWYKKWFEFLKN